MGCTDYDADQTEDLKDDKLDFDDEAETLSFICEGRDPDSIKSGADNANGRSLLARSADGERAAVSDDEDGDCACAPRGPALPPLMLVVRHLLLGTSNQAHVLQAAASMTKSRAAW